MQGAEDTAGRGVEHIIGLGVADAADGAAHRILDIYVGLGLNLAHHHHHAGGAEALAGHLGFGVLAQELVQDGVGNLVGHLVGMALAYRLGCEQIILHGIKKLAPGMYAEAKNTKH